MLFSKFEPKQVNNSSQYKNLVFFLEVRQDPIQEQQAVLKADRTSLWLGIQNQLIEPF
jgi:hypothetical protein